MLATASFSGSAAYGAFSSMSPSQLKAVLEYVQAQREPTIAPAAFRRSIASHCASTGSILTSGMFGIDDHPQNRFALSALPGFLDSINPGAMPQARGELRLWR
jgi:hypothetical protein